MNYLICKACSSPRSACAHEFLDVHGGAKERRTANNASLVESDGMFGIRKQGSSDSTAVGAFVSEREVGSSGETEIRGFEKILRGL